MHRLKNKIALITGAARGIGQAIAEQFIIEGAQVVLSDINDELGQTVALALGENAHYLHLDVRLESDWQMAAQWIENNFGKQIFKQVIIILQHLLKINGVVRIYFTDMLTRESITEINDMTYEELKEFIESDAKRVEKLQSIKIGDIGDIDKPRDDAINRIYQFLYDLADNSDNGSLVVALKWNLESLFPEIQRCTKKSLGRQFWSISKIKQTNHGRYAGHNLHQAFKDLKKGRGLLDTFRYRHLNKPLKDLVSCLNSDSENIPSVYYSRLNPNHSWNHEGNNRIIISKTIDEIIGLNNNELLVDLHEVDHDISGLIALDQLITDLFEAQNAKAKFSKNSQSIFIFSDQGHYQIPTKIEHLKEFISTLETRRKSNWTGRLVHFYSEWWQ